MIELFNGSVKTCEQRHREAWKEKIIEKKGKEKKMREESQRKIFPLSLLKALYRWESLSGPGSNYNKYVRNIRKYWGDIIFYSDMNNINIIDNCINFSINFSEFFKSKRETSSCNYTWKLTQQSKIYQQLTNVVWIALVVLYVTIIRLAI